MRAKRQTGSTPGIDWSVTSSVEPSKVDSHPLRVVHFKFQRGTRSLRFTVTAEEAMDLREEIGRAYDAVN